MTKPTIDKHLRAHFKEWARRIIANERSARKHGRSQNTIGEIERALVEAYRLGRRGESEYPDEYVSRGIIDWIEIPSRARDVLFSISIGLNKEPENHLAQPIKLERVEVKGSKRWRVVGDTDESARTFSDRGVLPLEKLTLLERVIESDAERLRLTDLGVATCREYWRRWEMRDPSLPI